MTYLDVNAPFLAAGAALVLVTLVIVGRRRAAGPTLRRAAFGMLVSLIGVVVLTAVFDNVIILTGVVDYDHTLTSGTRIGVAPIEDFAYALFAALVLPAVWLLVPPRRRS